MEKQTFTITNENIDEKRNEIDRLLFTDKYMRNSYHLEFGDYRFKGKTILIHTRRKSRSFILTLKDKGHSVPGGKELAILVCRNPLLLEIKVYQHYYVYKIHSDYDINWIEEN